MILGTKFFVYPSNGHSKSVDEAEKSFIGKIFFMSVTNSSLLGTIFITAITFLVCADQTFATRLGFANIRWGQILLFLGMILGVFFRRKEIRIFLCQEWAERRMLWMAWFFFGIIYLHSSFLGDYPFKSFLKFGWAFFNFLICFLFVRTFPRNFLWKGVVFGSLLIALVIFIDAIWLYWGGHDVGLLGYVQESYSYLGRVMRRPHAFYYEPSYAASLLCWMGFLLWIKPISKKHWINAALTGFIFTGSILTSSRSGTFAMFFGCVLFMGMMFLSGFNRKIWLKRLGRVILSTALFCGLFALHPGGQKYFSFIYGPLGVEGSVYRLKRFMIAEEVRYGDESQKKEKTPINPFRDEQCQIDDLKGCNIWNEDDGKKVLMSEGARLRSFLKIWDLLLERSFVGRGVQLTPSGVISIPVSSMWFELGMEGGALAAVFFFLIVLLLYREGAIRAKKSQKWDPIVWIPFLCLTGILFNLTINFPRLDYWWTLISFSLAPVVSIERVNQNSEITA